MVSTRGSRRKVTEEAVNVKKSPNANLSPSSPKCYLCHPYKPCTMSMSKRRKEKVLKHQQQTRFTDPPQQSSRRKPHAPRKFQIDGTKGISTGKIMDNFMENLALCESEQQTDEATFAAKYSGANSQAEHQLEDDQLSGSPAQVTIRNLTMQVCRRMSNAPTKFQIDGTEGRSAGMTEKSFTENLSLYKLEHQTDEATFAAKYSGANCLVEHQLEDDQLSGSLPQASIRNSTIQEVNTTSKSIVTVAEENALRVTPVSNGSGETHFSEKLDPFPKNMATASISLNMTEFAEQNVTDEFSDIDSLVGKSSLMSVRGYQVKPEYEALLTSILSKHGDIGAKCSLSSVSVRSWYMEKLCDIVQKLSGMSGMSIGVITEHELQDMTASVTDIGNARVEVGWLKNRLDEIFEAKKAMGQLLPTSNLKVLHTQHQKRLGEMKAQLEEQKRDFANFVAQSQSDISTVENQLLETGKAISESRAKLKKVCDLGSLVNGLVET